VALVEPLLDEGEEHSVLLLLLVEKGADMPGAVEDRTRQPDLLRRAHRVSPFCQCMPLHADRPRRRSATHNGRSHAPAMLAEARQKGTFRSLLYWKPPFKPAML